MSTSGECMCGHRIGFHALRSGVSYECGHHDTESRVCPCMRYVEAPSIPVVDITEAMREASKDAGSFKVTPRPYEPIRSEASNLPASEICGECFHPRATHTPGKTPPCERGDGSACFCMKFKTFVTIAKSFSSLLGQSPSTLTVNVEEYNAAISGSRPIDQAPETAKASNPKEAFGSNKLPLHLWPATATAAGCLAFLHGALKYGKHNWREAGVRATTYVDAFYRHVAAWYEGEDLDSDSGLSHLAHALACIAVLVDAQAAGKLNDDRAYPGGYGKLTRELTKLVLKLKLAAELSDRPEPKHYTKGLHVPAFCAVCGRNPALGCGCIVS
jgi:hypothetical protein